MKYDFSLKYHEGKINTVADALSRISKKHLSDEEAKKVLEGAAPHTMSSETMKAVFDNLTSGASRRAELEYSVNCAAHHEASSIKVSVKSMRPSTQMHVMDWAEAEREEPKIKAAMDWYHLDKGKSKPWTEQLA